MPGSSGGKSLGIGRAVPAEEGGKGSKAASMDVQACTSAACAVPDAACHDSSAPSPQAEEPVTTAS